MRERLHAAAVIGRVQLRELAFSPGPYVTLAAGMAVGWMLCSGFARAIDSSGFDPRRDPVWDFLTRAFAGAFGPVFVERMLAEGPFLLIFTASVVPLVALLAVGSVARFGADRVSGALELIATGPADGTSCVLGSFAKDAAAAAAGLAVIALYGALLAAARNLVVGPMALAALPVIFLTALAVSAVGLLCAVVAPNGGAAVAVFTGVCILFLGTQAGALGASVSAFQSAAQTAARLVQWLSPFFYAQVCAQGYGGGNALEYGGGLALLAGLTAAALAASHLVLRWRGVRP